MTATSPHRPRNRSVVCARLTGPAGTPFTGGKATTTRRPAACSGEMRSPSQVPPKMARVPSTGRVPLPGLGGAPRPRPCRWCPRHEPGGGIQRPDRPNIDNRPDNIVNRPDRGNNIINNQPTNNLGNRVWATEYYRIAKGTPGEPGEDGLETELFAGL